VQEVRTANFYDVEDDRFVAVLDARNHVLVPLPREASTINRDALAEPVVSTQDRRGRRGEPAFRGADDGRHNGEVSHLPPYEAADVAPDTDGQHNSSCSDVYHAEY
jgi:hypothetical protein